MSDTGRKDVTDQVAQKVTPESQKSTLDKLSDTATSAGDKVVGAVQPNESKSTSQELADKGRSGADDTQATAQSYAGSIQSAVSDAAGTISGVASGE
ncbi:hypothetical protein MMC14_008066 [Varicellaria rhodocarpa]|nr:hypothetical protein [Varicellaria rhodocarpa]